MREQRIVEVIKFIEDISDHCTVGEADTLVIRLIERMLPAGEPRDQVVAIYKAVARRADA